MRSRNSGKCLFAKFKFKWNPLHCPSLGGLWGVAGDVGMMRQRAGGPVTLLVTSAHTQSV